MIQENQIYLIRNKKSNNVIVLTQGEDTVLNMGASNPVLQTQRFFLEKEKDDYVITSSVDQVVFSLDESNVVLKDYEDKPSDRWVIHFREGSKQWTSVKNCSNGGALTLLTDDKGNTNIVCHPDSQSDEQSWQFVPVE